MRKITHAARTGLTLIEIMVALSLSLVVFLGTTFIIVAGQKSWDRTLEQATVQRDASFAMLTIKHSLRSATGAELDKEGVGIKIHRSTGWIRFWYEPEQKTLRYQSEGQDEEQVLLEGIVDSMDFDVVGKSVTVDITLQKNSCSARLSSKTTMRNYKSET